MILISNEFANDLIKSFDELDDTLMDTEQLYNLREMVDALREKVRVQRNAV